MTDAAALRTLAGIGLRHPHLEDLVERPPAGLAWVEVHTENYMAAGGPRLRQLELVRERYALSFHGVGLSLGSADPPDPAHLARIKALADRFEPALMSEHVAWSVEGGHYLNDLFPIPYTEEALELVSRNIRVAQDALGRRLLVENPSSYLRFVDSTHAGVRSSWPSWSAAPAAGSCSTSTTSTSAPATTASTSGSTWRRCRATRWASTTWPATPRSRSTACRC